MKTRIAVLLAGLALASCGGDSSNSEEGPATVSVALTDAASDEIASFTVDVTAVTLRKWSGAVVGALSSPVSVDLVTLSDVSQILNVLSVAPGLYTSGTITFDYTNARCTLVGQSTPATIRDAAGNAVTGSRTYPIDFGAGALNALSGRHRVLELDFDLDQSVTVDSPGNTVTVEPTLVMRIDRNDPKDLVTVGELVSVDLPSNRFVADVKRPGGAAVVRVTYQAFAGSILQVDGVPSLGLAALAAKGAGTPIQSYGTVDPGSPIVNALYVEAGIGTWHGGTDVVQGHVTGRSGSTLTVLGHSMNAAHTAWTYNVSFTVGTSGATGVVRRGSASTFIVDDLNIGQRVRVYGALSGSALTASVIRQQPTRVLGYAAAAPSGGTLTMNLERVDLRQDSAFTWAESGATPPNPAAFTLQVGGLGSGLGIVNGTAVVAWDYFPSISDPGADFAVTSLINRDLAPSLVRIRNHPGGFTVTTSAIPSQIQFLLTGSAGPGEYAIVDKGFVGATTLPAAPTPTIVPVSGFTLFVIRDSSTGALYLYTVFADFSAALASQLGSGKSLAAFTAIGTYTPGTNTTAASLASAWVN